ncbi:sigma-70 domain-containing protein, partial [Enterobacter hormaechei]
DRLASDLRTARELSHKLDHEPSAEEIAEQLDKPVDDVSRMLRLNERITSVDTPLGGDSEKALLDILSRIVAMSFCEP